MAKKDVALSALCKKERSTATFALLKPLLKPLLVCSSARCTRSPERHALPSLGADEFGTASDPRRPTASKLKVLFTGSATTSKLNVSSAKRAVRAAERLRRQSSTTPLQTAHAAG